MAPSSIEDGPRDFLFEAMCEQAQELIDQGITVYQKFTCAGCGNRLTIDEPNKFYETGTCDNCDAVTNIKERGCNYLVQMVFGLDDGETHGFDTVEAAREFLKKAREQRGEDDTGQGNSPNRGRDKRSGRKDHKGR